MKIKIKLIKMPYLYQRLKNLKIQALQAKNKYLQKYCTFDPKFDF